MTKVYLYYTPVALMGVFASPNMPRMHMAKLREDFLSNPVEWQTIEQYDEWSLVVKETLFGENRKTWRIQEVEVIE